MQLGIASKTKLAIFLITIFTCCQAFSQTTGGTLRGIVKDKSGLVVDQSVIIVSNEATGARFTAKSSGAGLYAFPNLLPGNYTAIIEAKGFAKFEKKNVVVSANGITDLNAVLQPA